MLSPQSNPTPTYIHVELRRQNLLPLLVYLPLSISSQATPPQEALPDCLNPQNMLTFSSGDHSQYHSAGNHAMVTAASPQLKDELVW